MANPEIERMVDELIRKGRISNDMRSVYIKDIEEGGFNDSVLRGSDYTNKTKELAEQRRQAEQWLAQEREKIQAETNRLRQWESTARGELERANQVQSQLPELTGRLAAYEQKLKDYQIFDEVVVPPIKTPTDSNPYKPPQQTQPTPPVNKFLTVEDANTFGANMLNLMKKVNKINNEHQRLFGQPLDDDLIDHFTQTGQDPEEYWRVKHNVPGRQAEIAAKQREAEIAKIREEERAKIMSEISMDPGRIVGAPGSGNKGGLTPVLERYAHSRALEHSQNHADEKKVDDFIPPEKKQDIPSARERIAAASEMFHKHWDALGTPITEQGRQFSQKYSSGS